MAGYGDLRALEVDASPQECYDALTDFERLPEWQGAVKSVRVLERDEEGRGTVVEYEVDAKYRVVRYVLAEIHDPPRRLGAEYIEGDFRDFSGEWRFSEAPGGRTRVELDLSIDPGRLVPGPLRSAIGDAVMKRALHDLKAHVEGART